MLLTRISMSIELIKQYDAELEINIKRKGAFLN